MRANSDAEKVLPDVSDWVECISGLDDIGYARANMGGFTPVPFDEILAYLTLENCYFPRWFGKLLFKLSSAYAAQANLCAQNNDIPSPDEEETNARLKQARKRVESSLRGIAKNGR